MKNTFLLICFCLIGLLSAHAQTITSQEDANQKLQDLITKGKVVGASAGYAINGETKWVNAAGYADWKQKTPFTDTTLTRTASIAKCMTAIAIMQLVENEQIKLDDPIRKHLPDFPEKARGEITIRQLLFHTSGLTGYQSSKETESKTQYTTLQAAMDVFKDRPLMFEPGTQYAYTTYGYVVLGRILEQVSGMEYGAYMQQNIWDKAGMRHTGIERAETLSQQSRLYRKGSKRPRYNNLSNRIPGGGFYTTLQDMLRFGNAVVSHKLIQESTLKTMTEIQLQQKEGNPYTLGWFLYAPAPQQSAVIGHSGEQTGAATQLMLIPQSKTVIVVLANTSGTWKKVVTLCSELVGISERGVGG